MISRPRVALIEKRTDQQKLMYAKLKLGIARLNMTDAATLLQAIEELHEANEYLQAMAGYDAEKSFVHALYRTAQCIALNNNIELADEDKTTHANILAVVDAQLSAAEKAQVVAINTTEFDRCMRDSSIDVAPSGLWIGLSYKLREHVLVTNVAEITSRLAGLTNANLDAADARSIYDDCQNILALANQRNPQHQTLVALAQSIKDYYSRFLIMYFNRMLTTAGADVAALRRLDEEMQANQQYIQPMYAVNFAKLEARRIELLLQPYERYIEELRQLLDGDDAAARAEAADALKTAYPLYLDEIAALTNVIAKCDSKQLACFCALKRISHRHHYLNLLKHNDGDDGLITQESATFKKYLVSGVGVLQAIEKRRKLRKEAGDLHAKLSEDESFDYMTASYAYAMASYHMMSHTKSLESLRHYSTEVMRVAKVLIKLLERQAGEEPVFRMVKKDIQLVQAELEQNTPQEVLLPKYVAAYQEAKVKQDHAKVLELAKQLIEILEPMSADVVFAEAQMSIASIYIDMAKAELALLPSDALAREKAIKLYQKAINAGEVEASVYAELVSMLEIESQVHAHDHLASYTRETLAYYRSKQQPSVTPIDVSDEPVNEESDGEQYSSQMASASASPARSESEANTTEATLEAMSKDQLFDAIENGGTVSERDAFRYFKRQYSKDKAMWDSLFELVIKRFDGDTVRYKNKDVLWDMAHSLDSRVHDVPLAHAKNKFRIYKTLLKAAMVNPGNPTAASWASIYLGKYYRRRFENTLAKKYYRQAAEQGRVHGANTELSDMYLERRQYGSAISALEQIIAHPQSAQREIQGARNALAMVNYLRQLNEGEKKSQSSSQPLASKPQQVPFYFDLDNTIFLTSGPTDAFYADENNVPYASSKDADMNKFFCGGLPMWRYIFAALKEAGVDIGICTAKGEDALQTCPLYKNFAKLFPEIALNNRHVIFTNNQDKRSFLSSVCQQNGFDYNDRQYIVLVDDNLRHIREAAAMGLTVINANRLTKDLEQETFDAFKTHVIETARMVARDYKNALRAPVSRSVPARQPVAQSSRMPSRAAAPAALFYDRARDPRIVRAPAQFPAARINILEPNQVPDTSTADTSTKRRRFDE